MLWEAHVWRTFKAHKKRNPTKQTLKPQQKDRERKQKKKWGAALLLWTLMLIFQFCSFESFTEQKCKTLFFLALGGVVEKKRVICGLDLLICPLRSVIPGLDLMICTHVLVWGFILNDTSRASYKCEEWRDQNITKRTVNVVSYIRQADRHILT